jgi:small subunit ribosomal protein S4
MGTSGPRLKKIRRLGTPLPGLTRKVAKNTNPPGAHGAKPTRRRPSAYRVQLEEKQKLRWNYGVSERQLRRYFERATRESGPTGENLLELLERRLDSVVFRLGFAPTLPSARQLVSHGHVRLNERRVDRPGILVSPGDQVALRERARRIPDVMTAVRRGPEVRPPSFLRIDPDDPFVGVVVSRPIRADVPFIVDAAAVVEFYAR